MTTRDPTSKPQGPAAPPSEISQGEPPRTSFAELVEENNEKLVRFLAARLGDKEEARDVAQEAYVKLLGLENDTVINHRRAYLFRIAANIAVDRMRASSRRQHMSVDASRGREDVASGEPAADEVVLSREKLALLRTAITELPPKCRYAFLQYRMGDRSYRDIAAELDISESMARKYVLKAVRYCKSRLESED